VSCLFATPDLGAEDSAAMPSNIIYVGVPGFTAFTLVNLGQSALTVLENNQFLSGLSSGTPPDGTLVGQVAVVFLMLTSIMLIGMGCGSASDVQTEKRADMSGWVLLIYGGWAFMSFVKEPLKPISQRWQYVSTPISGVYADY
jgi:hypothetical protein